MAPRWTQNTFRARSGEAHEALPELDELLARLPRLDASERDALEARMVAGDRKARNRLIEANLKLVAGVASHYAASGIALVELINVGVLGMIRAAELYDPARGARYVTYATWWVRAFIARYVIEQDSSIRIPDAVHHAGRRLSRAYRDGLDGAEAREAAHVTATLWGRLQFAPTAILSLEQPVSKTAHGGTQRVTTLGDTIDSGVDDQPYQAALETLESEAMQACMQHCLTPRERQIITMRYGLGDTAAQTQSEVMAELGISRQAVSRHEAVALRKLREYLTKRGTVERTA